MKLVLTLTGPALSGKTKWLQQAKNALLATAPAEAIEIAMFEGDESCRFQMFDEFLIPAREPEGTPADGDQETYRIEKGAGDVWRIVQNGRSGVLADFSREKDARDFLAFKIATNTRRQAAMACLRGEAFRFNGKFRIIDRQAIEEDGCGENCKGGGGDFAKGAGVVLSIDHQDDTPLRAAARKLYDAGCWAIIGATDLRLSEQNRLWEALRDALDLTPGQATDQGKGGLFYHHGIRDGAE